MLATCGQLVTACRLFDTRLLDPLATKRALVSGSKRGGSESAVLQGKACLISGVTRGSRLGSAVASELLRRGGKVGGRATAR